MKNVRISYKLRNAETKAILINFNTEAEAINFAGQINKMADKEIVEVVKVITTEVIKELQRKGTRSSAFFSSQIVRQF